MSEIFVKEYSFMWSRLDLSLAECRVYAYIYGLTNSKHREAKGYSGSKRQLAQILGLDSGGVKKILDTLQERHLIVCTDDVWTSVESFNTNVDSVNTGVESVNSSVDSVNENVDSVNSPHTPLLNNNTEMERNEIIARDTIATNDPKSLSSFERLLSLYQKRTSNYQLSDDTRTRAQAIWESRETYPIWKKLKLMKELTNENGFCKPRLDWTLADYCPQPHNYRGETIPADICVSSAKFNGAWGMYTDDDIRDFGMTRAPKPKVNIKQKE